MTDYDHNTLIIGAGFGGIGAALALAERDIDVLLCETLNYPGGCASTFGRSGYRFEAGATLFSGFAPGQLFHDWIERHQLDVEIDFLNPVVELRTPNLHFAVPNQREQLIEQFCALPGAPREALRKFFALQRKVADALWGLLDDPALLPPFGAAGLFRHAARVPRYLPLLRLIGKPLSAVLERFGLADFEPLRVYLDAVSQITVQASSAEAEAPFALSTMDYFFRGTGHVVGGIGQLATALTGAIEASGGTVELANRVKRLEPLDGGKQGWRVHTRRGTYTVQRVIANLLPHTVRTLAGLEPGEHARLDTLADAVDEGWSACMLYLGVRDHAGLGGASAHHLELVQDTGIPFLEGNHLFCSISSASETERVPRPGLRTVTVSTHVPLEMVRKLSGDARAAYIQNVQDHMRAGLEQLAPELAEHIEFEMSASPRTFERFTGRPGGAVGGIPRRAGWHHYCGMKPRPMLPGLYLVGDSVFPGQSTLATALGGVKLALTAF